MTSPAHRSGAVRGLVRGVHLLFAALLLLGTVRAVRGGASLTGVYLAVVALVLAYGGSAAVRGTAAKAGWFAFLAAAWAALLGVSPAFAWVAFPLWLLVGTHLPARVALPAVLVSAGVVVAVLAHDAGRLTPGTVLGPVVGALVAVGTALGVQRLAAEAEQRRVLIEQLQAAQREAATLQDELAAAQRSAGAIGERERLAHEIHDTLAQGFSSLVLLARTGTADPSATLARVEEVAAENLVTARSLVAALAPAELDAGLPGALRRVVEGFRRDGGIAATLRLDGLRPMPTAAEVALLRAAQSALANVRAHAGASTVTVTLDIGPDEARLDVVDDGRGFDPATLGREPTLAGGYGLRAMRERLGGLGGGLEVESAPGEGTAVSAWVPLRATRHTQEAR